MKKTLFTIVALYLTTISILQAQNGDQPKTSFAILGGINFQNLNGKDFKGDKLDNDMVVGYHVGLNVQIPLVPEFYFQPGLIFNTKGSKHKSGFTTSTYRISYLEIPLNFVYKGQLGNGFIFLGLGPYVGYAIQGKVKNVTNSVEVKDDIEFTNEVNTSDSYSKSFKKNGCRR